MRALLPMCCLLAGACGEAASDSAPAPVEDPTLSSSSAAALYGLQVGAKWTFLRTDDVLRWKEITGCEDVLVIDPETGEHNVVRAYVRENRSEFGTTSVHYLIEDDEGVKRVRRDDVDEGELTMIATYKPAGPRLYNGPYHDGQQWSFSQLNGEFYPWSFESRGASTTSAVDEVLIVEDIEVMAGTFTTLLVERQWDANTAHGVQSHYATAAGEVRERTEWPTTPLPTVQIEELVAYTPGYGSCDGRVPLFDVPCEPPLAVVPLPWGLGPVGCTDLRVDAANCGSAGNTCESGVCAGGVCVEPGCALECEGSTVCSINAWGWGTVGCTSPARDKWNCGGKGVVCGDDEICDHGECGCAPGTGACDTDTCQDLLEDPSNCGACGNVCGGDTPVCDKGVCVDTCLSVDLTECGDECVDLEWDSNHCGSCDNECGKGTGTTSCAQGACVTCEAAGLTNCDDTCEDLRWSDKNCGECGHACGDEEVCVLGECVGGDSTCAESCADGDKICCGGECVDPITSDTHCGGCGVDECVGGCTEACREATCQNADCGGGED